jgi:DNA-binding transcriptional ArsR family regulator
MRSEMLFDALADPTRRQVIELLGARPMRAGELANEARLSRPAMSRHLRILLEAGVVDDDRPLTDARGRLFRLRPGALEPVRTWMDQVQAQWEGQLRAFKRHAEGGVRE